MGSLTSVCPSGALKDRIDTTHNEREGHDDRREHPGRTSRPPSSRKKRRSQTPAATESTEPADEKRPLKEGLREGAAKAFGLAVEVGSLLGGQSGEIVDAEREVASSEAEEFIDRIDGEG